MQFGPAVEKGKAFSLPLFSFPAYSEWIVWQGLEI
jgi:hypothetical protein